MDSCGRTRPLRFRHAGRRSGGGLLAGMLQAQIGGGARGLRIRQLGSRPGRRGKVDHGMLIAYIGNVGKSASRLRRRRPSRRVSWIRRPGTPFRHTGAGRYLVVKRRGALPPWLARLRGRFLGAKIAKTSGGGFGRDWARAPTLECRRPRAEGREASPSRILRQSSSAARLIDTVSSRLFALLRGLRENPGCGFKARRLGGRPRH